MMQFSGNLDGITFPSFFADAGLASAAPLDGTAPFPHYPLAGARTFSGFAVNLHNPGSALGFVGTLTFDLLLNGVIIGQIDFTGFLAAGDNPLAVTFAPVAAPAGSLVAVRVTRDGSSATPFSMSATAA